MKRLPLFIFALLVCFAQTIELSPAFADEPASSVASQEYYELRIYQIFDYEKQLIAEEYLANALLPALQRQNLDRIGVFTNRDDENDHSIFLLIPYPTIEAFTGSHDRLDADEEYQSAAAGYFERELKDPVFSRIESRLMKAFAGIPVMEVPDVSSAAQDRIFELRLYQSHTEDHARRKVKMFDDGEIQIMRDTGLAPVFFGQTLIGPDQPNLIYMLSAANAEAHQSHWKSFKDDPEWNRIKKLEEYKDTVSKIQKWILTPTAYSQL